MKKFISNLRDLFNAELIGFLCIGLFLFPVGNINPKIAASADNMTFWKFVFCLAIPTVIINVIYWLDRRK